MQKKYPAYAVFSLALLRDKLTKRRRVYA